MSMRQQPTNLWGAVLLFNQIFDIKKDDVSNSHLNTYQGRWRCYRWTKKWTSIIPCGKLKKNCRTYPHKMLCHFCIQLWNSFAITRKKRKVHECHLLKYRNFSKYYGIQICYHLWGVYTLTNWYTIVFFINTIGFV